MAASRPETWMRERVAHARALRDIEFFLADHNNCGGLQVRTCPPTVAVGYYLVLTCFCGGFRVKWAMSEQALFNLVWPFQPYTSNYGRFVGFARPNNPPPMGSRYSLFIRDRQTGTDELVSVDVDGNEGNGSSSGAAISADGRFVATRRGPLRSRPLPGFSTVWMCSV